MRIIIYIGILNHKICLLIKIREFLRSVIWALRGFSIIR